MVKSRILPECNYKSYYFNGKTIRVAIDPTKDITELTYPEFYDVKITDHCEGNCPYCYMDSTHEGKHVLDAVDKVKDYFGSMSENNKPFQVALGGGEPTKHPQFIEILKTFYDLGITPNYTTNGMNVNYDIVRAARTYCNGVAISCHEHLDLHWQHAATLYRWDNIKLNFHIIISDKYSIDRFVEIYNEWRDDVDYFVLLPYGDQGRAKSKHIDWEYLVSRLPEEMNQIAFGANFYGYLQATPSIKGVSLYEPESMSKFLDLSDMKLYPSSFNLN